MLFVTKGKKKKLLETKLLPPDEQSLHMEILRTNFVSYGATVCLNQHFEIVNQGDYSRKVSEGKLEPNWLEGSSLSSIEDNDHEQRKI